MCSDPTSSTSARPTKGRVGVCHLWHTRVARLYPVPYVSKAWLSHGFDSLYLKLWCFLCTLDTLFVWQATLRCFDVSTVLIAPVAALSCSNTISPSFCIKCSEHPSLSIIKYQVFCLLHPCISYLSLTSCPLEHPNPHLPLHIEDPSSWRVCNLLTCQQVVK